MAAGCGSGRWSRGAFGPGSSDRLPAGHDEDHGDGEAVPSDVAVAGGDALEFVVTGGIQAAEFFLPFLAVAAELGHLLVISAALGHAEPGAFLFLALGQGLAQGGGEPLEAGDARAALVLLEELQL